MLLDKTDGRHIHNPSVSSLLFGHVPRYIEHGDIRLRPLRIFDGPFISNGLKNNDILTAGGLNNAILKPWFLVWWWLKRKYVFLYCIEVGPECVGFTGLYNLSPDRSAELTLAIFDTANRRRGYGTKVFNLLAQNLKRYFVNVEVKVKADNHAALSFWSKLGFKELCDMGDIKMLHMDLKGND